MQQYATDQGYTLSIPSINEPIAAASKAAATPTSTYVRQEPGAPSTSKSKSTRSQATKSEDDSKIEGNVRIVVMGRFGKFAGSCPNSTYLTMSPIDDCMRPLGLKFKRVSSLPWSTMATELVEVGLRVIGYPRKTPLPWEVSTKGGRKSRGILDIPKEAQGRLLEACAPEAEHRLTVMQATSVGESLSLREY